MSFMPTWTSVIFTCVIVLILFALIYGSSWHEGERDRNRFKYSRIHSFVLKGVVAGLLSEIPLVVVFILFALHMDYNKNPAYYLIFVAFNMPYLSYAVHFRENLAMLSIMFLPVPLMSGISYYLGFKGKNVFEKLVYTKKPKNDGKNSGTPTQNHPEIKR
jgi:uncharacterized membrane protein YfcA